MMNGFNLSDWNYNDNSDLSLFIIADDSMDLIKDYFDIMTDRLNWESQIKSTSVILQNSFSLSNISCNVDNGNGGGLLVAVAAWRCRQRWRQHGVSGGGGSLGVTLRWRWQRGGGNSVAVAAVWWQQRGSMKAVAAAQLRWWGQQCCAAEAWQHDGSNMRMRCY